MMFLASALGMASLARAMARWIVFIVFKLGGRAYEPMTASETPENLSDITVVTPVHREDPAVFERALRSWIANGITRVIVVSDEDDKPIHTVAMANAGAMTVSLIRATCSKREALGHGINAAETAFVILADSDTYWPEGLLRRLMAPFVDPCVGAVTTTTRADALDTFAQRLFDVSQRLWQSLDFAYESAKGTVPCLIGRTSMYRREALLQALPALCAPSQLHHPGDDAVLTHELRKHEWKLAWQSTAVIYTTAERDMLRLLSQMIRWRRNVVRIHASPSSPIAAALYSLRAVTAMTAVIDLPAILVVLVLQPLHGILLGCTLIGSEILAAAITLGAPVRMKDVLAAVVFAYMNPFVWMWAMLTRKRSIWSNRLSY